MNLSRLIAALAPGGVKPLQAFGLHGNISRIAARMRQSKLNSPHPLILGPLDGGLTVSALMAARALRQKSIGGLTGRTLKNYLVGRTLPRLGALGTFFGVDRWRSSSGGGPTVVDPNLPKIVDPLNSYKGPINTEAGRRFK